VKLVSRFALAMSAAYTSSTFWFWSRFRPRSCALRGCWLAERAAAYIETPPRP
jgi:hypothetical protein